MTAGVASTNRVGAFALREGVSPEAAALTAALGGSPDLLLHMLTARVRDASLAEQGAAVIAQTANADNARLEREQALQEAREAAEKAAKWGGLGDILKIIVDVVVAAVAVVASVYSGGAALPLAGMLLATFSPEIVDALVEAGIVPKEIASHVQAALSVAGGIMSGGAGLVAAGGDVLQIYAPMVGEALEDAGASSDVAKGFSIGLSVTGGLASAGAGAVESALSAPVAAIDASTAAARNTIRAVHVGVALGGAGTKLGMGIVRDDAIRDGEHHRADALRAKSRMENATQAADAGVEQMRDTSRIARRQQQIIDQITEARDAARTAALSLRA